jgi:hypothetical protein
MSEMVVRGKAAVAEHFGVSVRQIRNWERAGMPGRSGRSYDLVEIHRWRDQKQGRGGEGDSRQGFLSVGRGKDFQEERLKKAQADLKEMEVRRERGELVERREISRLFVDRVVCVKQGLVSLSRALPPLLVACTGEREMEVIISAQVRSLLENYSRAIEIRAPGPIDRAAMHEFLDALLDQWEAAP